MERLLPYDAPALGSTSGMRAPLSIAAMLAATALCTQQSVAQVGGPSNDFFKAEMLDSVCNPPTSAAKADKESAAEVCGLYFRGLTDGLFLMKTSLDHGDAGCLPSESPISEAEARGDFELFLRDHPEAAKNAAGLVATFAIMRAHPCQK